MSISRLEALRPHASDPRLALLRGWLSVGVVLLVLLPPSQWHHATIGWLPYWLLVAPLISLALLRRRRLAAALAAFLDRGRRRRNSFTRRGRAAPRARRPVPASRWRPATARIPR